MAREEEESDGGGERFISVAHSFCTNLEVLTNDLSHVQVHYTRCINPNHNQKEDDFDSKYVLNQLVQCGTVQLVWVMRQGYPRRAPFRKVRTKFDHFLPKYFHRYSDRKFVECTLLAYEVPRNTWFLGKSRLFYKTGPLQLDDENAQPSAEVEKHFSVIA